MRHPDSENFYKDLEAGKEFESMFADYLESKGWSVELNESDDLEQLRKYDLTATRGENENTTFEMKNDIKSIETGNFCFEVRYKGYISGVFSTEAEFICIKSGDEVYIFNTEQLRLYLGLQMNFRELRTVYNGRAQVMIIPKYRVLDSVKHTIKRVSYGRIV